MSEEVLWKKIEGGVFVIAEIGKNFIQSEEEKPVLEYLKNAKKLALAAKEAGADAVKFQTHNVEDEQIQTKVVSPHFKGMDRYSWVKRNTLVTPLEGFWKPLKAYCDQIGITFFSTPMSRGAAEIVEKIGVDLWKVGSGDILDFVMLDYLTQTKKPIILSAGMSTLEELDLALNFLKKRKSKFALLHCVSQYPCPLEKLNLSTLEYFKERYECPIGFSDHSVGEQVALAAVKQGAKIIEKHFSFGRDLWGSDHKVSMTPKEMKEMIDKIRLLEKKIFVGTDEQLIKKAMGKKGKILQEDEAVFRPFFRKALVAGCEIKKGEKIQPEMIYAMRPQAYIAGLHSEEYEKIVGKVAKKKFSKYEPFDIDSIYN
ncbi:MAG: N-acetylneuraminate synthase family protein [Patescibacteria group bacterium]